MRDPGPGVAQNAERDAESTAVPRKFPRSKPALERRRVPTTVCCDGPGLAPNSFVRRFSRDGVSNTLAWGMCLLAASCVSTGSKVKRTDAPASTAAVAATPPKNDGAQSPAGASSGAPAAAAENAAPAVDAANANSGTTIPIHGSVSTLNRFRSRSGEHDIDTFELLSLDVGDPKNNALTGHFMGRVSADLDGHSHGGSSVFNGLEDTYDQAVLAKIYEAYVDVQKPGPFAALRVGRQFSFETPEFAHFDGATLTTKEVTKEKLSAGLYGGVPVHLWDSSGGNEVLGVWMESRPWSKTRARLDWMHLEDEALLGKQNDDLWSAGVWQGIGESVRVDGAYSRIENRDRDLRFAATYDDPKSTLDVQASFYELLQSQKDLALEVDPLTSVLQEYFPYRLYGLNASRSFGEHFDLQAGADLRRVRDSADIGTFNRDYDHQWATGTVHGVVDSKLSMSLTADHWASDDQSANTWGFDASRDFGTKYKASLGTYWSLYKFELALNRERDHVRTWYLKLRCAQTKALVFNVGYEFEDDGTDQYHTLEVGAVWHF